MNRIPAIVDSAIHLAAEFKICPTEVLRAALFLADYPPKIRRLIFSSFIDELQKRGLVFEGRPTL